jgi:orotidine-5'-phosphate decarboxylase
MENAKEICYLMPAGRTPGEKLGINQTEVKMVQPIMRGEKSLIVAMDVDGAWFYDLVAALELVESIGAVKFGFFQLNSGLESCIDLVRSTLGEIPIIYDYQKISSGVTDAGSKFAKTLKRAGIDAVIIYPFAGPKIQEIWTKSLQDEGLCVLVGGMMTHPNFLVSEGGYVADEAVLKIYSLAIEQGVEHFLVPGNKLPWVTRIKALLDQELGQGNYVLCGNGFLRQGGDLLHCLELVGNKLHAIIGAGIYDHKNIEDMRKAAILIAKQLQAGGVAG